MNSSTKRVLTTLKRAKSRGITATDFPTGFAIRSRISDLRGAGHHIKSAKDGKSPLFRYWLVKSK